MHFCYPNKPVRIYSVASLTKAVDLATWIVQPKWNGHRALPYCDVDGRVTVYNRMGSALNLAASNFAWLGMLDLPRPWALDAELLRDGRMIAWDFSMMDGSLRVKEPYSNRLAELKALMPKTLHKERFSVELIETLPAKQYKKLLLRRSEPELEGFVLKQPQAKDLWGVFSTREIASQVKFRF